MNNFIIAGCQRSGTTLLKLILDEHSQIDVIDEDVVGFHGEKIADFNRKDHVFGFKLPMVTNNLDLLKSKNLKLVHIIRDPRDVIKSMLELPIEYNLNYDKDQQYNGFKLDINKIKTFLKLKLRKNFSLPWAIHPSCIDPEFRLLQKNQVEISQTEYTFINQHPLNRQKREAISILSKIWNNKNEVINMYKANHLDHIVIRYEDLLQSPQETISNILNFLGLEETNNLLDYYKKNQGVSIGNTKNDAPIKQDNTHKWEGYYSTGELAAINSNCKITAEKFKYRFNQ